VSSVVASARLAHMLAHQERKRVTLPGQQALGPEPEPPQCKSEPEPEVGVERVIDSGTSRDDLLRMLTRLQFEHRKMLVPVYLDGKAAAIHLAALLRRS
jgi:DNA-directed RNA polymerase specialized sigma24 family protein